MECTCDYPEKKYNTWTEHSTLCSREAKARENPGQRVKQQSGPPKGLPRKLLKRLRKEGVL